MTSNDWDLLERNVEYETEWYDAGYDRYRQPDGTTKKYYWCELSPASIIVAVGDDYVVFVEQFRPVIGEKHIELPAGIVEDNEDFRDAAERELKEETGYIAGETTVLQDYWVSTGVLRHRRGIVAATELEKGETEIQENEFIETRTIPIEKALEVAREPPTNDATIEGLYLAHDEELI